MTEFPSLAFIMNSKFCPLPSEFSDYGSLFSLHLYALSTFFLGIRGWYKTHNSINSKHETFHTDLGIRLLFTLTCV